MIFALIYDPETGRGTATVRAPESLLSDATYIALPEGADVSDPGAWRVNDNGGLENIGRPIPLAELRDEIERRLRETEFALAPDARLSPAQKAEFVAYRRALRDFVEGYVPTPAPVLPAPPSREAMGLAEILAQLDHALVNHAEVETQRITKATPRLVLSYLMKLEQAREVERRFRAADPIVPEDFPHLVREVGLRAETIEGVARAVLRRAEGWIRTDAQIEFIRQRFQEVAAGATSPAALRVAFDTATQAITAAVDAQIAREAGP